MQSGETPGCPFVGDDSIMQRTYKSAPNAQNGHGKYYQRNLAEVALAYLQEGGTVRCFVMTLRAAGEIVASNSARLGAGRQSGLRPWRSVVRAVLQMPCVVGSWARSLWVT